MAQIVFDITPRDTEIARERRHTARLVGEQREKVATKGHSITAGPGLETGPAMNERR